MPWIWTGSGQLAPFLAQRPPDSPIHMVVVASCQQKKNMLALAQALHLLQQRGCGRVITDWYGATPPDDDALVVATAFINRHNLAPLLRFHPPVQDIEKQYQRADVVGLFSKYEGLPNVVCEGMACGKPIVMSDVCDARRLVEDGKNGFLCDRTSPDSIANALNRVTALTERQFQEMGRESRRKAEALFDMAQIVGEYEAVLESTRRPRQQ